MKPKRCAVCENGPDPTYLCPYCSRMLFEMDTDRKIDERQIDAHEDLVAWVISGRQE